MIQINRLSVNFTGDFLFRDVSFSVGDRDRVGLVGHNGAGKSTLLKIINRDLEPTSGSMVITSGHRIGYLPQELAGTSKLTVWDEAISAFKELKSIESDLGRLTAELAERDDYQSAEYAKLAQRISDLNDIHLNLGGSTMEADTEKVLLGMGFLREEFGKNMSEFSNGWQMRVCLAKILLQKPEIILLDEPTNHLDIESIQWLEDYLVGYDGCVILVSHDRAFLDRVTTRTIEITLGNIQDYKCSYSKYVEQRLERIENQQSAFANQQKEIARIERFIERFRYKATKSAQVQSRIKMLEKMDRVEVDGYDNSAISFKFPPAPHSGLVVVETKKLSLGYDTKPHVLKDVDFRLERGERVAFVGRNGEGKSTMVKAIVGALAPEDGSLSLGYNVVPGYYAQNQAQLLNPEKTVFETIDDVAVGDMRPKIRTMLGSFLFDTEDTEKKVKVLSGGEKARLAIAKLLLSPFNLLILDEPTNHLDMPSKDVLKNALLQYEGSLILVSHDRDFLQGLTSKVYEFRNHGVNAFSGDVYDFLNQRRIESLNVLSSRNVSDKVQNAPKSSNKALWEEKKLRESDDRKRKNRLKKIEETISLLQKELADIEARLADPESNAEEIASGELYQRYQSVKDSIEENEMEWLELSED
ncbi:MAG: ABC-F family ATP-binding cassette domain-containing protein [Bacteroidales bacterium]|nr:ABC-F family ATP-binding cassette domain-containing protein [Bacteroidales bacterium]